MGLGSDLEDLRRASWLSLDVIVDSAKLAGVGLKKTSLSEWFNGKTIPSDPKKFAYLVDLLEGQASQRPGHKRRTVQEWEARRKSASRARQSSRRSTSPAASEAPALDTPPA